ncbi:MAG: E3 ubiquitin ligase family protein [Myxococcaceae bacterium]|nr:E3 ubiquitin ligase family protein [Myxococcaceae bacterium]
MVGLGVLGFGLWNHLKGKRILAAPFKGTGELAKNPTSDDPKGAISTEGAVKAPAQQFLSPCSKTPCIYYEVKIERLWEKTETTQDGTKTVKGSDTLDTVKGGALVSLDDGTGAFQVDFSKGADFDNLKESFKKELNGGGGSSHLTFGQMNYDVPVLNDREKWTIGFRAVEKTVPASGNLFVLGKVEGSKIVKPGWRSMMASSKGREGLLGSIQKKKKFSFIGGGVAAVAAIPLMIFGPKSEPSDPNTSSYCNSTLTDARARCSDTVSSKDGETYTWTTTKPGKYALTVYAPAKKVAFAPAIEVKDGEQVLAEDFAGIGENATVTVDVQPGTHTVVVKPGDGFMVKGGFSFDFEIAALGGEAPAAVAADAPSAEPMGEAAAAQPEKALLGDEPPAPAKTVAAAPAGKALPMKKAAPKGLKKK